VQVRMQLNEQQRKQQIETKRNELDMKVYITMEEKQKEILL
jgi:hypothetical protein